MPRSGGGGGEGLDRPLWEAERHNKGGMLQVGGVEAGRPGVVPSERPSLLGRGGHGGRISNRKLHQAPEIEKCKSFFFLSFVRGLKRHGGRLIGHQVFESRFFSYHFK